MMLQYRQAVCEDIPALVKLGLASYGRFRPEMDNLHWQEMERNLHSVQLYTSLLCPGNESIVCTDGETIVGMAFLIPSGNPTDIYPADWSYIRMVGVHPEYSGRGIGRRLTGQCVSAAQANGEKIIGLHTSEMMHSARHIYESLGFTRHSEIAARFGKRYWLYRKELTPATLFSR